MLSGGTQRLAADSKSVRYTVCTHATQGRRQDFRELQERNYAMLIAKVEGFHLWSKSDAHNTGELINTSLHALQSFPISVEVQLLGSICDD